MVYQEKNPKTQPGEPFFLQKVTGNKDSRQKLEGELNQKEP